jgi:tripartite-type tricarboxylate transporter receptor subunit TctC
MRATRAIAAIAVFAASCASASSQSWPTRPVTMVIPYAVGGPIDIIGRILAPRLSELLGQRVIVENVAGAGGMTGSSRVANAMPDGYQFVLGNVGSHAANQSFYKSPLYDSARDFAAVLLVAETPMVLLARTSLPGDNLLEFISYARVNTSRMQFGSGGLGSASHLACALLNAKIGIAVTHVPYRGAAPAMQDLIAGRIDYQCPDTPIAIPQLASGTIKAIAILTAGRSNSLPALASAHEQGLTDFAASNWFALFLPNATPGPIIQKLHDAAVSTLETSSVQQRMKEIDAAIVPPQRRSREYLQKFVEAEIDKWARLVKASGAAAN